ncbi:hypothetical protein [Cronobacter sakazakii]|uniref:hypothetical protein n=1 Tax=Cronobacter sakazakii TaxID=28141 RepID=UPI0013759E51|nr:hypothetical protein [Cronobacter sakazakii]ELY2536611.1 hypothetical protein [Cronobacter sakazakii]ELY2540672.1 hypothetical protein [Cronobacter sakazakii]ELY4823377.1 hypothetical protein [Cronobacter sakazakii]ELY4839708.1 hypothetical protein [Cronobacter sakazakii]ELY5865386.1 hypothetical protein [Cronobacter sakazakii]
MTKIYITKYALTSGVFTAEADVDTEKRVASFRGSESGFWQFYHGDDFHFNEEAALARAEEMRIKKLKSLDKQMKKISAIKFEIKD